MPRRTIAWTIGLLGFTAYVVGVVTLGDRVVAAAWPLQAAYFLAAGTLWVFPARALILWAVRG